MNDDGQEPQKQFSSPMDVDTQEKKRKRGEDFSASIKSSKTKTESAPSITSINSSMAKTRPSNKTHEPSSTFVDVLDIEKRLRQQTKSQSDQLKSTKPNYQIELEETARRQREEESRQKRIREDREKTEKEEHEDWIRRRAEKLRRGSRKSVWFKEQLDDAKYDEMSIEIKEAYSDYVR